jgi:serine/threonine protein kinase
MQTYAPGTRIGQYEIASRPMIGGMGVVYFAIDHGNDGRPVALKTFRPEFLPDRAARDRFLREGSAWVELGRHPHIVRCYKVEYIDPTAFLVLELIAKEQNMPDASLRSWLIHGHPLPLEQALLFAVQIARGMQYATEKIPGFVHRDLKPENILVGADRIPGTSINRLRVTDFGLVKTIAESDISTTVVNAEAFKPNQMQFTQGVGTPLYMAPEQWKSEPIGIFTDVYAFGCLLYEMLSGEFAVDGQSIAELQVLHCEGRIRAKAESFPGEIANLVAKCLALKPDDRYKTWKELYLVLQDVYFLLSGQFPLQNILPPVIDREERLQIASSYSALGTAYLDLGRAEASLGYFNKALDIADEIGDKVSRRNALNSLGAACMHLGNPQQAVHYFVQAIAISHEIGDKYGEGAVLGNLGVAYKELGDIQRSINSYEQWLMIAREVGDREGQAQVLNNLGIAQWDLGNWRQAIEYYEMSEAIEREAGNLRGLSKSLANLGIAYADLGYMERAMEYYEQNLRIAREIGDRRTEGEVLGNIGRIYVQMGEAERSIESYQQSLLIAREIGDRSLQGSALQRLGVAYRDLNDVEKALRFLEESLVISREISDRHGEGSTLGYMGQVIRKMGDFKRAVDLLQQALLINREIGNRQAEGYALANIGSVYIELGDFQNAVEFYKKSLAIFQELGDQDGAATGFFMIAQIYDRQGNTTNALSFARNAAQIWLNMGSTKAQAAQKLVAELQGDVGHADPNQIEAAFEAFQHAASPNDIIIAVKKYPFMADTNFIEALDEIISTKIPPNNRRSFQERLATLRQIANQK